MSQFVQATLPYRGRCGSCPPGECAAFILQSAAASTLVQSTLVTSNSNVEDALLLVVLPFTRYTFTFLYRKQMFTPYTESSRMDTSDRVDNPVSTIAPQAGPATAAVPTTNISEMSALVASFPSSNALLNRNQPASTIPVISAFSRNGPSPATSASQLRNETRLRSLPQHKKNLHKNLSLALLLWPIPVPSGNHVQLVITPEQLQREFPHLQSVGIAGNITVEASRPMDSFHEAIVSLLSAKNLSLPPLPSSQPWIIMKASRTNNLYTFKPAVTITPPLEINALQNVCRSFPSPFKGKEVCIIIPRYGYLLGPLTNFTSISHNICLPDSQHGCYGLFALHGTTFYHNKKSKGNMKIPPWSATPECLPSICSVASMANLGQIAGSSIMPSNGANHPRDESPEDNIRRTRRRLASSGASGSQETPSNQDTLGLARLFDMDDNFLSRRADSPDLPSPNDILSTSSASATSGSTSLVPVVTTSTPSISWGRAYRNHRLIPEPTSTRPRRHRSPSIVELIGEDTLLKRWLNYSGRFTSVLGQITVQGRTAAAIGAFIHDLLIHLSNSPARTFDQGKHPDVTIDSAAFRGLSHIHFIGSNSYYKTVDNHDLVTSSGHGVRRDAIILAVTLSTEDTKYWSQTDHGYSFELGAQSPNIVDTVRSARFTADGRLMAISLLVLEQGYLYSPVAVLALLMGRTFLQLPLDFLKRMAPAMVEKIKPWAELSVSDPLPTDPRNPICMVFNSCMNQQTSSISFPRTIEVQRDLQEQMMCHILFGVTDPFIHSDFRALQQGMNMSLTNMTDSKKFLDLFNDNEYRISEIVFKLFDRRVKCVKDVHDLLVFKPKSGHQLPNNMSRETFTGLMDAFSTCLTIYLNSPGHPEGLEDIVDADRVQADASNEVLRSTLLLQAVTGAPLLPGDPKKRIRFDFVVDNKSDRRHALAFHTCWTSIDVSLTDELTTMLISGDVGKFEQWIHKQLFEIGHTFTIILLPTIMQRPTRTIRAPRRDDEPVSFADVLHSNQTAEQPVEIHSEISNSDDVATDSDNDGMPNLASESDSGDDLMSGIDADESSDDEPLSVRLSRQSNQQETLPSGAIPPLELGSRAEMLARLEEIRSRLTTGLSNVAMDAEEPQEPIVEMRASDTNEEQEHSIEEIAPHETMRISDEANPEMILSSTESMRSDYYIGFCTATGRHGVRVRGRDFGDYPKVIDVIQGLIHDGGIVGRAIASISPDEYSVGYTMVIVDVQSMFMDARYGFIELGTYRSIIINSLNHSNAAHLSSAQSSLLPDFGRSHEGDKLYGLYFYPQELNPLEEAPANIAVGDDSEPTTHVAVRPEVVSYLDSQAAVHRSHLRTYENQGYGTAYLHALTVIQYDKVCETIHMAAGAGSVSVPLDPNNTITITSTDIAQWLGKKAHTLATWRGDLKKVKQANQLLHMKLNETPRDDELDVVAYQRLQDITTLLLTDSTLPAPRSYPPGSPRLQSAKYTAATISWSNVEKAAKDILRRWGQGILIGGV
ncbi:hypothetical protein C8J56DRAFT_1076471 [Mycena floridula]|nr:hypothetical protein C8J56DRAFT_1076471 [Mycena floridula]